MIRVNTSKAVEGVRKVDAKLRALAAAIGTEYTAKLPLTTEASRKLVYFSRGARHQPAPLPFTINPLVERLTLDAVRVKFGEDLRRGSVPSLLLAVTVGVYAMRRVWVERLEHSGGDTPFAPLSPRYVEFKRRRGLDPRIGVATGRMLADVKRAQVVVQEVK